MTQLVRYEQARSALAACHTVDEVKDIRDKAEAMAAYAQTVGDKAVQMSESEIVIRAERRLGQLLAVSKAILRERKDSFIALARSSFTPSPRASCAVCGKFPSLTQAHHLVPLSVQFDRGYERPDHAHAWLCPTHHAALHVFIGQSLAADVPASKACIEVILDIGNEKDHLERLLDLLSQSSDK